MVPVARLSDRGTEDADVDLDASPEDFSRNVVQLLFERLATGCSVDNTGRTGPGPKNGSSGGFCRSTRVDIVEVLDHTEVGRGVGAPLATRSSLLNLRSVAGDDPPIGSCCGSVVCDAERSAFVQAAKEDICRCKNRAEDAVGTRGVEGRVGSGLVTRNSTRPFESLRDSVRANGRSQWSKEMRMTLSSMTGRVNMRTGGSCGAAFEFQE